METIKTIYRIGQGPSSSHTMGPKKASEIFLKENPDFSDYKVTLYGALAATGVGHLTDKAIFDAFKNKNIEIEWEKDIYLKIHPNAMKIEAIINGETKKEEIFYSIGGGKIITADRSFDPTEDIYPFKTMDEILRYCNKNGKQMWEVVFEFEKPELEDYLYEVWKIMQDSIHRGLINEGALPGGLNLPRKASATYTKANSLKSSLRRLALLFAFALAVAEENAGGGKIVTAPTCGSSGVLPAMLYYLQTFHENDESKIIKALATAGLIGAIVRHNASISGAEVGCQGEIGTACAMASGAATQLFGGTIFQVEYAAEMGLEHHLGLTCDPIKGLVQIPCIERNVFAASRALTHNTYAILSDGRHRISFDEVVEAMKKTGTDMPSLYKETAKGGLAMFDGLVE
ncbi:L-serine ammonia-lyase [Bacteroidales bacterium OttesenSCG-928-I21]|nr:L-serine ammonia-lyase [Bacteroidales bacterium OttesenSCG-928-I21]